MIYITSIYSTALIIYLFVCLSSFLTLAYSKHIFFYIVTISTMAFNLKPNATTAEINEFLAQVRIPNFRIHPRLVEFNDTKDR
jgi:hypothetical protein